MTDDMREEIEKCPDCQTPLIETHEMRGEVGMYEVVLTCEGCGYCETG